MVYGSEIWGAAMEIKAKRKILAAVIVIVSYLSTHWHLSEEDSGKRRGKISSYGDGIAVGVRKQAKMNC